jgi:cell wall-associated NlpC family hydrolase
VAVLVVVIAVSGTASVYFAGQERDRVPIAAIAAAAGVAPGNGNYRYERLTDPPRTVVAAAGGAVIATLTDGSRTVVLTGAPRTFSEPKNTTDTVTTTAWVRLAPQPWTAGSERAPWFGPWLTSVLGSDAPDILAIGMQYLNGAPPILDDTTLRIAGDASFAPDADFDRYLGVAWRFADGAHDKANATLAGSLDSAGFVRMVFGYRAGYPLLGEDTEGAGLPRSAAAMDQVGPGTSIVADNGQRPTDYSRLQPGDLLFFATGPQVSHVGIYLGIDNDGHRRVLSSRESADGPTFGDAGGGSFIDGDSKYAQAFRAAKRL